MIRSGAAARRAGPGRADRWSRRHVVALERGERLLHERFVGCRSRYWRGARLEASEGHGLARICGGIHDLLIIRAGRHAAAILAQRVDMEVHVDNWRPIRRQLPAGLAGGRQKQYGMMPTSIVMRPPWSRTVNDDDLHTRWRDCVDPVLIDDPSLRARTSQHKGGLPLRSIGRVFARVRVTVRARDGDRASFSYWLRSDLRIGQPRSKCCRATLPWLNLNFQSCRRSETCTPCSGRRTP